MSKVKNLVFIVIFVLVAFSSFFAGKYSNQKEILDLNSEKCNTFISFAIEKLDNQSLTDKGVKEALISNIYATYQFCDDSYLSQQLHDLWNMLLFEDISSETQNAISTQLKEIAYSIKH